MQKNEEKQNGKNDKNDVNIIIQSGRGEKTFTFPKSTKIQDVINKAIEAFGYPTGSPFSIVKDGEKLAPERTLVSYHLNDGDTLQLVDVGGGV